MEKNWYTLSITPDSNCLRLLPHFFVLPALVNRDLFRRFFISLPFCIRLLHLAACIMLRLFPSRFYWSFIASSRSRVELIFSSPLFCLSTKKNNERSDLNKMNVIANLHAKLVAFFACTKNTYTNKITQWMNAVQFNSINYVYFATLSIKFHLSCLRKPWFERQEYPHSINSRTRNSLRFYFYALLHSHSTNFLKWRAICGVLGMYSSLRYDCPSIGQNWSIIALKNITLNSEWSAWEWVANEIRNESASVTVWRIHFNRVQLKIAAKDFPVQHPTERTRRIEACTSSDR